MFEVYFMYYSFEKKIIFNKLVGVRFLSIMISTIFNLPSGFSMNDKPFESQLHNQGSL